MQNRKNISVNLPGYDAVYSSSHLTTFQRNVLPPTSRTMCKASRVLAYYMLGLHLDYEDGDSTLFRKLVNFLQHYTASHPRI
jgi:hypothetical protein